MMDGAREDLSLSHAGQGADMPLAERTALLRELDHRVKNNIQLLISLLNMSAQQVKDVGLHPVFVACRDRMTALSLVHDTLYQSSSITSVDVVSYLERLIAGLSQLFHMDKGNICLEVEEVPLELNTDRLVDLGMVLSELLSNAYKHAYPCHQDGVIRVEMKSIEGDRVELVVADHGVGMTAADATKDHAFGLKFVGGIIERNFAGDMQIQHGAGTRVVMRFPICL
jgi:two-component sensor histidine kinase